MTTYRRVYLVEVAKKDAESLIVSMLEAKTFSARRLGANSLIKLIFTSKLQVCSWFFMLVVQRDAFYK